MRQPSEVLPDLGDGSALGSLEQRDHHCPLGAGLWYAGTGTGHCRIGSLRSGLGLESVLYHRFIIDDREIVGLVSRMRNRWCRAGDRVDPAPPPRLTLPVVYIRAVGVGLCTPAIGLSGAEFSDVLWWLRVWFLAIASFLLEPPRSCHACTATTPALDARRAATSRAVDGQQCFPSVRSRAECEL
jgi:hypothetical protein